MKSISHGDRRPESILLVVMAVAVLGALFTIPWRSGNAFSLLDLPSRSIFPLKHAKEAKEQEVRRRFEQGVAMLNMRQYDFAITAFHRVLELSPQMPEAHVNLGFAFLGAGQFKVAADFFSSAIALRADQANAYYGLAEALDAQGDRMGAIGAMRTFVHRHQQDDVFSQRAWSALWEWETALKDQGIGAEGGQGRAKQ